MRALKEGDIGLEFLLCRKDPNIFNSIKALCVCCGKGEERKPFARSGLG